MDFSLTDEQTELKDAFAGLFEKFASVSDVRAAEPLGFSPELWSRVRELGFPEAAAVDADEAATLSQVVVVAEEYGRSLAPVPIVDTLAAARAIARAGGELPDGVTTLAVRPVDAADTAFLLPAGAVADHVVALVGEDLVLAELVGDGRSAHVSNLGSSPLANRVLGDRAVLASGSGAHVAFEKAVDDWRVLTSAALVGLTEQALNRTIAYVKERHAFGVPIGWFQTVAHTLADRVNESDGARFITHKAAWAVDSEDDQASRLVSMAYAFCAELAARATADALHLHGGIGYTMEHDIQLYFRRAKAWPLQLGDPRLEFGVVADRMFGERRSA